MSYQLLLTNVTKHIQLTSEEETYFLNLFKPKKFKAAEFLLHEGEICRYESYITKGSFKNFFSNKNGDEQIIDFLIEQWWTSDFYSFVTGTPSKTSIQAIEDAEVLQISNVDLEKLYAKVPKFERFFRLLFQSGYISYREQLNNLMSFNAKDRYQYFMQKKPYANERFSQKDIASYLGITPQFFSALKKKVS